MVVVGCDPDLRLPSFAVVREGGEVAEVHVLDVPRNKTGQVLECIKTMREWEPPDEFEKSSCICVEGQEIRPGGQARPNDIKSLGQVAGAAISMMSWWSSQSPPPLMLMPSPSEWKGSVPKQIHQARICARLGWRFVQKSSYCVPEFPNGLLWSPGGGCRPLRGSDWKHGLDAVGLAVWAYDRIERLRRLR